MRAFFYFICYNNFNNYIFWCALRKELFMFNTEVIKQYLYLIPVILVSLTFHEYAHALVSYKLGDPTPKDHGRLTLNPLKHLDILGTLMMFIARLGWAKPVPINPLYYKDRKKGTILVSIAGPLSNVILAFIAAIPLYYIKEKYRTTNFFYLPNEIMVVVYRILLLFYSVNIGLAAFNIIPVPPLDGSKVLTGLMPAEQYYRFMHYEKQISIVFMLLVIVSPTLIRNILYPFTWIIETAIKVIVVPIINIIV